MATHENNNGISEDNINTRLECPICLQYLNEAVLTSCGHRFCDPCIRDWISKKGALCPLDNKSLDTSKDIFPDLFTRREVASLGITTLNCPFSPFGCNVIPNSKNELEEHIKENTPQHLQLVASSVNSGQNKISYGNEYKPGQDAPLWDPEPKSSSSLEEQEPEWRGLLRGLYQKIVYLEQTSREQAIQIERLKNEVRNDFVLRYCHGSYIWKFSNFEQLLDTSQERKLFYSPGFYTSPNGYIWCARLNLSQHSPAHIALHLHLMQTDHDEVLNWPFTGRLTLCLVHPTDPDRSIRDTIISNSELEAFQKPQLPIAFKGFGFTEFAPIEDLIRPAPQGFLHKDALIFSFNVSTV